ncbi:flagellar biosynthesis protein FliQ [Teredinibacter sp. KSP-S5-2]|uniref:flagellar biosynthesis protein FliQ n=1 Tax=Teredinibacter sp. KSP-S5-2 TaxID=3034506 RepID=UPI002934C584|nr:flagellar biosynthesis protein FliQ [Teredinibacter sp. KSP-S5-2]WNO11352.1 flagellar biosynthesis protein FliQ [Teredinibacter sp. KSP-S5-2]
MEQETALFLLSETMLTAAKVSAPMLFTSLAVGLVVSIFQVVTQIQEMTLTFVPKIIASVFVALMMGGWMLNVLAEFTRNAFRYAASG